MSDRKRASLLVSNVVKKRQRVRAGNSVAHSRLKGAEIASKSDEPQVFKRPFGRCSKRKPSTIVAQASRSSLPEVEVPIPVSSQNSAKPQALNCRKEVNSANIVPNSVKLTPSYPSTSKLPEVKSTESPQLTKAKTHQLRRRNSWAGALAADSALRCHYSDNHYDQNIVLANSHTAISDYFRFYKSCPSGQRVSPAARRAIAEFMLEVGRTVPDPVSDFTTHMAINLFDRYLGIVGKLEGQSDHKEKVAANFEAVAAACLWICSKIQDIAPISLEDCCRIIDNGATTRKAEIREWERDISTKLEFKLTSQDDSCTAMSSLNEIMLASTHESDAKGQEPENSLPSVEPLSSALGKRKVWSDALLDGIAAFRSDHDPETYFKKQYRSFSSDPVKNELLAHALAIGEYALLHHTTIGMPIHLIATAAQSLAQCDLLGFSKDISNLSEDIRLSLGPDRDKLLSAVKTLSAVMAEKRELERRQNISSVELATTATPSKTASATTDKSLLTLKYEFSVGSSGASGATTAESRDGGQCQVTC